jgi:hypothetical protein
LKRSGLQHGIERLEHRATLDSCKGRCRGKSWSHPVIVPEFRPVDGARDHRLRPAHLQFVHRLTGANPGFTA